MGWCAGRQESREPEDEKGWDEVQAVSVTEIISDGGNQIYLSEVLGRKTATSHRLDFVWLFLQSISC